MVLHQMVDWVSRISVLVVNLVSSEQKVQTVDQVSLLVVNPVSIDQMLNSVSQVSLLVVNRVILVSRESLLAMCRDSVGVQSEILFLLAVS